MSHLLTERLDAILSAVEDNIARDVLASEFDKLGRSRAAQLIRDKQDNSHGAEAAIAAIKRVAGKISAVIGIPLSRLAAYAAVNSERDYQDAGRGNAAGDAMNSIPEHLLVIEKLLDDAKRAWYRPGGSPVALQHVRKIAGVAVRCMEVHGAPLRS